MYKKQSKMDVDKDNTADVDDASVEEVSPPEEKNKPVKKVNKKQTKTKHRKKKEMKLTSQMLRKQAPGTGAKLVAEQEGNDGTTGKDWLHRPNHAKAKELGIKLKPINARSLVWGFCHEVVLLLL